MLRRPLARTVLPVLLALACTGEPVSTDPPAVDADNDGYTTEDDCDDDNPDIHPGATENCEEDVDYDCDGSTDYDDQDKDGFAACVDCNDLDNLIRPDAAEVCDEIDNDCDELVDDADDDLEGGTEFFSDTDMDGLGDAENSTFACVLPAGHVENDLDCDDADDSAGEAGEWFLDSDGDGYGSRTTRTVACDQPDEHVAEDGDCDDGDDAISPAADEVCDEIDNDCDGRTDDEDDDVTDGRVYYPDLDEDGYGDELGTARQFCRSPDDDTWDRDNTDCDDADPAVNPGMRFDFDDDVDNDCDTSVDEDVGSETYTHDSDIQPIWNSACTRCHGSSGGLSLSSSAHGRIVNEASSLSGYDYIEPGLPASSYLFRKVDGTHTAIGGTGSTMPRGGRLSSSDLIKIRTWIEEGAVK